MLESAPRFLRSLGEVRIASRMRLSRILMRYQVRMDERDLHNKAAQNHQMAQQILTQATAILQRVRATDCTRNPLFALKVLQGVSVVLIVASGISGSTYANQYKRV